MPKKGAANGAGGKSGSPPTSSSEKDPAAEEAPDGGARGGCCGSLLLLVFGLLLGAGACLGAAVALEPKQLGEALAALGVQLPRPPASACPACPKCPVCAECPASPACPADAGGCERKLVELRTDLEAASSEKERAEDCGRELARLKGEMEEMSGRLPEAQAAWEREREALWLACNRSVEEAVAEVSRKAAPQDAVEEGRHEAEAPAAERATSWPECVEQGIVLRGKGVYASFEDIAAVLGDVAKGCWDNDCSRTDKFQAPSAEDCARVCAGMPRCAFWTFGFQDGADHCFLRTSDAGSEAADGFVSAASACRPPAGEVSPAQAALAVLDSPALGACDAGAGGDACPDLHAAMRTWNYGIQNLRAALDGAQNDVGRYLEQIAADADAFLGMPDESDQLAEFYSISAANNRQVFEAVRSFLVGDDGGQAAQLPSVFDVSLPRPARGLLCRGDCLA